MRITKRLYKDILKNMRETPPESGGILGSNRELIFVVEYDEGIRNGKMCSYSPNVKFLNHLISEWEKKRIVFAGIFHTHYFGVKTLSDGDRNYIELIMKHMPDYVSELYFPLIVMPQKELIVYKAIRLLNQILIQEEELVIE